MFIEFYCKTDATINEKRVGLHKRVWKSSATMTGMKEFGRQNTSEQIQNSDGTNGLSWISDEGQEN